jgi:hypothetical protein
MSCASILEAGTVIVGFTGSIDSLDDPGDLFEGTLTLGVSIDGAYTYSHSPDVPPPIPGVPGTFYLFNSFPPSPFGIALVSGGHQFSTGDTLNIHITNDFEGIGDQFRVVDSTLFGFPIDLFEIGPEGASGVISLSLVDPNGVALDSEDLIFDAPPLSAFEQIEGRIGIRDNLTGKPLASAFFSLDALYLVPEPNTLFLLAVGVGALGRRTRRPQ